MKRNESINLYGKKVSVKYVGAHYDRNRIRENYYLLYDEAEVYHIEDANTKEIVRTFPASSYLDALEQAIMILDMEKFKSWVRGPIIGIRYELIQLMVKIKSVEEKYLTHSQKSEIESLLWSIDKILVNDEENKKNET